MVAGRCYGLLLVIVVSGGSHWGWSQVAANCGFCLVVVTGVGICGCDWRRLLLDVSDDY